MARRMPIVIREELSPENQAAYDEVAGIRGRPPEVGPSSVMIHNPEMAAQVNRLSVFLMADTDLPEKFRRLGALIAARSIDCRYVWNAHAAAGRRAGLDDTLVDAMRDRKPPPIGATPRLSGPTTPPPEPPAAGLPRCPQPKEPAVLAQIPAQ